MSQQAQIDALEHLLMAVLRTNGMTLNVGKAFESAAESIMGSDGPPDHKGKTEAMNYLAHLKSPFKPDRR